MNRFAYWVSAIFNPLFVGIPVMLAIGIAETGIRWEATPTVLAAIGRLVVATLAFGLPNVILIALISLRLKVSLHCAGIGGMLPAVAYPFGMPGLTAGTAALLLTAWSRVRMNEHSTIEVITGSLLGAGLMALELAWLFGWPRVI